MAGLDGPPELPDRWYGYEGVDLVVLATADGTALEAVSEARFAALEEWVRRGGRLVVSVARNWDQVAASRLAELLPISFDPQGTVSQRQLSGLEAFCGSKSPLIPPGAVEGVPVARVRARRGVSLAEEASLPLIVRGPYGFGEVTVVALDLDRPPFDRWEGRRDFWRAVLELPEGAAQGGPAFFGMGNRSSYTAINDLSSQLRVVLEAFEGVQLVPFGLVAFFIGLYILLIGPADYFLLKKVWKRLEMTWVTFPLCVVLVSAAAYFTAYALKGRELRANQVEVIDIDVESGLVRGTTWFSLFSPRIDHYSLSVQPQLGQLAPGRPGALVSWLGLPEASLGGMYRRGGVGLFRRGYRFGPDAQSVEDVPIQVWSTKSFSAQWQQEASGLLDVVGPSGRGGRGTGAARLHNPDSSYLVGALSHHLDQPLEQCVLLFGNNAYLIGSDSRDNDGDGSVDEADERVLAPGVTVPLGEFVPERAGPLQSQPRPRRLQGELQQQVQLETGLLATPYDRTNADPDALMRMMMFYKAAGGASYTQGMTHSYLAFIDLSGHLKMGRAVLLGKLPASAPALTQILRDGKALRSHAKVHTYVRFLIPVDSRQ
ncbi:MAG: hypothetical protein HY000_39465 [Planctomycetes bacterium]|nr:hypothetical protein [Planctomycetota bacterium]